MKTLPLQTHPQHLELCHCRAIDGDSIEAQIKLPLGIYCKRRIRLKGFFAPEMKGAFPQAAEKARQCLQNALDVHTCHIACHGMKEDRYGRIAATLMLNGRAVHGGLVLGELQLDPKAHGADLLFSRGVRKGEAPL